MIKKYSIWIFVAAVVMIPVTVFAIVKWYEVSYTSLPVMGGDDHRIAPFELVSHTGATTSLADWENQVVVADFFFTHCTSVCPKMTRSMKRVQELFSDDKEVKMISYTVDPERDTPERLSSYMESMNIRGNWIMVTGGKKDIYKLARNSFKIVASDGDGGPQDFIHSELLVLIDKQKRIRGYYNGTLPAEVDELLRDINRLKKEK
jgi:protein SCO1